MNVRRVCQMNTNYPFFPTEPINCVRWDEISKLHPAGILITRTFYIQEFIVPLSPNPSLWSGSFCGQYWRIPHSQGCSFALTVLDKTNTELWELLRVVRRWMDVNGWPTQVLKRGWVEQKPWLIYIVTLTCLQLTDGDNLFRLLVLL